MKSLMRSLLIALIPACPLIFSSCETSLPDPQPVDEKPAASDTHTHANTNNSTKNPVSDEKPPVSDTHTHANTNNNTKTPMPDENLVTDSFKVGGLTCSDCNNILKTSLENHPGIISADVDYEIDPSEPNTVVKHQAHVSREDIIKIITDTRYTVEK